MDIEKLLKRIEMREEWLNGERVSDQFRLGYSKALEFVQGCIIALEEAEELSSEEEARQEFIREKMESDCE